MAGVAGAGRVGAFFALAEVCCLGADFLAAGGFAAGSGVRKSSLAVNLLGGCDHSVDAARAAQANAAAKSRV